MAQDLEYKSIFVWGAKFHLGQPFAGVAKGPESMREANLIQRLKNNVSSVTDFGDVEISKETSDSSLQREVARFGEIAYGIVKREITNGNFVLSLGGDHSISIGTVAGHLAADPDCVVVWVDAHSDINTLSSSQSGNMHGMPLSFNIQQLQEEFPHPDMNWLTPKLPTSQLVYVGLRDVDEPEKEILADLNIKAFYMEDVDRLGIVEVVEEALKSVDPHGTRNIHLSFDIDSLDPKDAPATGTAVGGGLTLREGLILCNMVHRTGRLKAVDMVEVNPSLASNKAGAEKTVNAANDLLMAALGFQNSLIEVQTTVDSECEDLRRI